MINFCVTQFLQPSAVATVKFFYYNVALTFITNNNNNTATHFIRNSKIIKLMNQHLITANDNKSKTFKKTVSAHTVYDKQQSERTLLQYGSLSSTKSLCSGATAVSVRYSSSTIIAASLLCSYTSNTTSPLSPANLYTRQGKVVAVPCL